jgi:hypothetical protein
METSAVNESSELVPGNDAVAVEIASEECVVEVEAGERSQSLSDALAHGLYLEVGVPDGAELDTGARLEAVVARTVAAALPVVGAATGEGALVVRVGLRGERLVEV